MSKWWPFHCSPGRKGWNRNDIRLDICLGLLYWSSIACRKEPYILRRKWRAVRGWESRGGCREVLVRQISNGWIHSKYSISTILSFQIYSLFCHDYPRVNSYAYIFFYESILLRWRWSWSSERLRRSRKIVPVGSNWSFH